MDSSTCSIHDVKLVYYWDKSRNESTLLKGCPFCLGLILTKFTCDKCGFENSYWGREEIHTCSNCSKGKINPRVAMRQIPDWRLNVDDAPSEEVLKATYATFGMPVQSREEWDKHYSNEPYELEKQKEFETNKSNDMQEVLG